MSDFRAVLTIRRLLLHLQASDYVICFTKKVRCTCCRGASLHTHACSVTRYSPVVCTLHSSL